VNAAQGGHKLGFDSVYFLTFGGWKTELQSNRWHYASRWARTMPVVIVEPARSRRQHTSRERDSRLTNVEILQVPAPQSDLQVRQQGLTAATLLRHMDACGHRRPLLWAYNPSFAGIFAALPAHGRVYHATENYFAYSALPESFLRSLGAMIRASDVVVAVSEGVARAIAREVPGTAPENVSNGCEYGFYAAGTRDRELAAAGAQFERMAVYAGNINGRLDFDLLDEVARRHPEMLLAFFGPTHDLVGDDRSMWTRLRSRDNVAWFGVVSHERLPDVYATADLGLIPYKATDLLVEYGFPLKALEMAATGLPSVSTRLVALEGLAAGIVVTDHRKVFVDAVGRTARSHLSREDEAELQGVASANDYDAKFAQVVALLRDAGCGVAPSTKVDVLASHLGSEWVRLILDGVEAPNHPIEVLVKRQMIELIGRFPRRLRNVVPESLRRRVVKSLSSANN
jgi:glycosyltransferase involved in cell wall biosynthesis